MWNYFSCTVLIFNLNDKHCLFRHRFLANHPPLFNSYFNPIFHPRQVDAQEKKKPKTGRAKRRQQYNSRFVNVVIIPGRRRGPNSNA